MKAYQFIVLDGIAVYPESFNAQIIVNTTRYFQDPDGVPSREGGISGATVPFPNGAPPSTGTTLARGRLGGMLNIDFQEGLQPPVIIQPATDGLWKSKIIRVKHGRLKEEVLN